MKRDWYDFWFIGAMKIAALGLGTYCLIWIARELF